MEAQPVYAPKVRLFDYTQAPLRVIASAWKAMHGQYLISPYEIGTKSATDTFREIITHQHKTSLEYVKFTFGLEDVSRAFQQQLTRHRVGVSFSIQSLRMVDLSSDFKYVVPHNIRDDEDLMFIYQAHMNWVYNNYIDFAKTMPIEAARGILPLNICSNITMNINYRALLEMANQRFCSTTQGEFQDVMNEIKDCIYDICPLLSAALMSGCEYTKKCSQGEWSCGKFPN